MRRPDPYRKGGPHDDVARNIRNEQMADGRPSKEEAKQMHRQYLRDEGCEVCDEDDPDRLEAQYPFFPSCRAMQHPPDANNRVLCERHVRPSSDIWWAEVLTRAIERDAYAVVRYECDNYHFSETPTMETVDQVGWEDGEPIYMRKEVEDPRSIPRAPIECRCGAELAEVVKL